MALVKLRSEKRKYCSSVLLTCQLKLIKEEIMKDFAIWHVILVAIFYKYYALTEVYMKSLNRFN